jgi:putative Mn2+ efflux pump MntP
MLASLYIEGIDHWVAFILLAFVGIKLIRSGFEENGKAFNQDPSTGKTLVLLSIATSIDAFAVGLSISFLKVPIAMSILLI